MFDTLIRGGSVIDGTGAAPRRADIAIRDGRIVAVGEVEGPAREVIDAAGAIVTPGFIDVHTHYDGQFMWDDRLDPSFSHGVTTAIGGNCGIGFAPAAPEHRRELIELMEGVEDIPGAVLHEGLDWNWSSFGDYLDRLGERRFAMDVGLQLTHSPLRVFVMGERALNHEGATADDVAEMTGLLRAAMAAGALGFSSARLVEHLSSRGAHVPGTFADDEEVLALARAMGESGRGVFQIIPKGTVGNAKKMAISREARCAEHDRLEAIAAASGRPVIYTALQFDSDPEDVSIMLDASAKANNAGLRLHPMIGARPIGIVHMLDGYHVFTMKPSYRAIAHLPPEERAVA
ncbi:MAG: D-aminoacylase, partial [Sphingomonadales bacterium]